MKKVILSIATVIALASCSKSSNIDKKDMPTSVAYKFKNEKFDDTLHIIKYTDKNQGEQMYMFNAKNHFEGKVDETNDNGTVIIIILIIGLLLGIALGAAIVG